MPTLNGAERNLNIAQLVKKARKNPVRMLESKGVDFACEFMLR